MTVLLQSRNDGGAPAGWSAMTEQKTPMNQPPLTPKQAHVPGDLRELSYEMWLDRPTHSEFHGISDARRDADDHSTGKAE